MGEYADAVAEHGSMAAAARAKGIPKTTFHKRFHREQGAPTTQRKKAGSPGLTAEQVLLRHSTEHQIRHAAAQLVEGTFIPEAEFIRETGVSGGYKHIVERDEFAPFRGVASGQVVYWSHPTSIAEMRKQHVLR